MDFGKASYIQSMFGKGADRSRSSLVDGSLVIDCRGCGVTPVPSSEECIGCMIREMSGCGGSDRIVLRTGKDLEISGDPGKALRDVAGLRRWSLPDSPPKGRCATCKASRYRVMERAWATFPTDGIPFAREMLDSAKGKGVECTGCMESTRRELDLLERRMKDIEERMVRG